MSEPHRTAIIVHGAAGRMGQALLRAALPTPAIEISGALVRPGSALAGAPLRDTLGAAAPDLTFAVALDPGVRAQVLIDFSTPPAFDAALALALDRRLALISGTTGLDSAQHAAMARAARDIPVLWASNFSIGVALLTQLVRKAAEALPDWDCEIVEAHHRRKQDAPSGTALSLGAAIAAARGVELEAVAVYDRHGHPGARRDGEIGFSALRGGDIAGDHTVLFAGEGERIEITHRAHHRDIFAQGALAAAVWLAKRPVGRYGMQDLLG